MPIIEVKNVTKEYNLGQLQTIKRTLINAGKRLRGQKIEHQPLFKALDNISFSIEQGEVVGIIGHNGAGKSTLLKLLSRINKPTSGTVTVNGRIAPLIEVGAGLVGDMTGRENIYLNAIILGLSRAEIDSKIDQIIEFSELQQFIDTPVKRYSSGMQVKLGFSIATATDNPILIVDEVLAVGDLNFQRKCLERMESLIKLSKRTVLVVGHNIRQLERICSRMILLSQGQIVADGSAHEISNLYFEQSEQNRLKQLVLTKTENSGAGVKLESLKAISLKTGNQTDRISMHDGINFSLIIHCQTDFKDADVAIGFHTIDLLHIATFNTAHTGLIVDLHPGNNHIECIVPDVPLLPGIYGVRIGISDCYGSTAWYAENIINITIDSGGKSRARMSLQAVVDVPVTWNI